MNELKKDCQEELKQLKEDVRKVSFTIGKYLKYGGYKEVNMLYRSIDYNLDTLLKLSEEMEEI